MSDILTDLEMLPEEALEEIQTDELANYDATRIAVGKKLEVLSQRLHDGKLSASHRQVVDDLIKRFNQIESDELTPRSGKTKKEKMIDNIKKLILGKNRMGELMHPIDELLSEVS